MPELLLVELDGPASRQRTSEVPLSRDSGVLAIQEKAEA